MNVEEIRALKKKEIHDKLTEAFENASTFYTNHTELADLSADELRSELLKQLKSSKKEFDLQTAIKLFHCRMLKDGNSYNALVDVLTKEALMKAKEFEKIININNTDNFPLFGYIVSIKDSFRYEGKESSCGIIKNMYVYNKKTPFISYLESKGAVCIARGNIPQLLFSPESDNNIFGAVSNPHKKERTSGGSSGGDAALVALGHVNSAIGSDTAGSLRIPALFCGVYTICITSTRMDFSVHHSVFDHYTDFHKFPEKQFYIFGTAGPLTKNVKDLKRMTEVMLNYHRINCRVPPVRWNSNIPKVRKVGVLQEWDNFFELTSTNRRAMKMAEESLNKAGIETVTIDMRPYIIDLIQNIVSIFFQNKLLINCLNGKIDIGEPIIPAYKNIQQLTSLKNPALKALGLFITDKKRKIFINGLYNSRIYSGNYFMQKVNEHKSKLVNDMLKQGIDVFLCPGMLPAAIKTTTKDCNLWATYMFVWNALNFAAGAMPITRVSNNEQNYDSKFNDPFEVMVRKNMREAAGLPVGVQIVSLPFKEEKIIQVMEVIEAGVNYH